MRVSTSNPPVTSSAVLEKSQSILTMALTCPSPDETLAGERWFPARAGPAAGAGRPRGGAVSDGA